MRLAQEQGSGGSISSVHKAHESGLIHQIQPGLVGNARTLCRTFDMSQPLDLGPSSKSTDKMWMVEEGAMFGTPLHNFGKSLPFSLSSHPHLQGVACFRWPVSGFPNCVCRPVSAEDSTHRSEYPLPEFPSLCSQHDAPTGRMGEVNDLRGIRMCNLPLKGSAFPWLH